MNGMTYTNQGAEMFGVFAVMGIFIFILVICLIMIILQIIGKWKMFEKANVPGWKSLIPFYHLYIQCQIVGLNTYWILIYALAIILSGVLGPFAFIGTIVNVYFAVLLSISTAKSYGKDEGFGVGLFFLGPIFYMILGLDKNSKYLGKKPMHDLVFDDMFKTNNNNNTKETEKQEKPKAEADSKDKKENHEKLDKTK